MIDCGAGDGFYVERYYSRRLYVNLDMTLRGSKLTSYSIQNTLKWNPGLIL